MYCPNCAFENQTEIRFCTRCGTNLAVVSEALGSKPAGASVAIDERLGEVIKDYYHGRRDTITGIVLLPAAVKAMALLVLFGLPKVAAFFIVSWMVFWGIAALAGGLGKWIAASGEMKALGYTPPRSKLWTRAQELLSSRRTGELRSTNSLADRIESPASVTEHTTRQLEERSLLPPSNQPEQTN